MNRRDYVCRRRKLATFLIRSGFDFTNIRPDRDDPTRFVFLFLDTPELREKIEEYYSMV